MKLETKIQILPGVGPKMAQYLERLGISTIRDLLFYWPRAWQDFSAPRKISSLRIDDDAIIKAKILSVEPIRSPKKWMSIIHAELEDETGKIKAIWFNQPYLVNQLKVNDEWLVAGKIGWDFKNKTKTISPTQLEKDPVILPIYPETAGLTSKFLRKIIKPLLSQNMIDDYLPDEIRDQMMTLQEAVSQIHFPDSNQNLAKAKSRLAYDELFLIALRFLTIKKELQQNKAPSMKIDESDLKDFVSKLPYILTNAQRKSAWEIIQDLGREIPMNRLLEGDVGSGKTVVATMAVLVASKNNLQSVWLAPTEILANQHYQNVTKILAPFGIKVGLLTSANKIADTQKDDLIIGTHALIQHGVGFSNLGLIIIDEQHRFGVAQRAHLRKQKKDYIPHLLSMTATPIPRTLALALYGDLDISIIDELPPGRQEIITKIITKNDRQKTYDFIENEIEKGRQAFVICPLIDESKKQKTSLFEEDKKSAILEFKKLSEEVFPKLRIGLMHGKLKSSEKDEIMQNFKNREIDILVSTAVVEVGIDIPNATVMMIEDAERFGLAQLHQFRGRVGRGEYQSFCFLFSESNSANTAERMKAMTESNNGFKLAQIDLQLRGSGEIVGLKQSGIPELKIANLSDTMLIGEARTAAQKVVSSGLEKYPALCEKLKEFEIEKHLE